jgi:hypothetical protein
MKYGRATEKQLNKVFKFDNEFTNILRKQKIITETLVMDDLYEDNKDLCTLYYAFMSDILTYCVLKNNATLIDFKIEKLLEDNIKSKLEQYNIIRASYEKYKDCKANSKDILNLTIGKQLYENLKTEKYIEILPIAYLRGVNIDNAIVIIDEVQNISIDNIRTILTRLGENSKMVFLGDIKQIDSKNKNNSALKFLVEQNRIYASLNYNELESICYNYDSTLHLCKHSQDDVKNMVSEFYAKRKNPPKPVTNKVFFEILEIIKPYFDYNNEVKAKYGKKETEIQIDYSIGEDNYLKLLELINF